MSEMGKEAERILKDAESLYHEAMRELDSGKLRDAAEKAWGATVRATNALILARTGKEIDGTRGMTKAFEELIREDRKLETLEGRYFTRESFLHGHCFYMGILEPREQIERRIVETMEYIQDARKLARKVAERG